MSRQVATRGMLAIPLTPEMNESLLGYLTRVAERNVLERPAVLLEGIASWPPSQLTTQQQAQLARVLGLWPRQVKSLFDRTYRSGLSANLVSHERRRVSPLMLKQTGCDQALWAVKPLSFCCESWRELIDACPHCGQALRWGYAYLTRCQSCEADLTPVETRAVQPELRATLRAAARLAAGVMPKWDALGSSLRGGGVFHALISKQLIVGVWEVEGASNAVEQAGFDRSSMKRSLSRLVFERPMQECGTSSVQQS